MRQAPLPLIYSIAILLFFLLLMSHPFTACALESHLQLSAHTPSLSDKGNANFFTKTYSFTQLNWNDSNTLRGDRATTTFYLPVPKQWKYTTAKLHLLISHSPLLQDNSTLTLELNGKPVSSIRLTKENATLTTWDIELPLDQPFASDWIALNFVGFLRISADICADYDNPSNWAFISPNSTLTISYKKLNFSPDLGQLPYPFIYTNPLEPLTSLLVLPQNPSIKEVEPALRMVRALGAQLNYNQINLSTTDAIAISNQQKENNNLIFVGKVNQFSSVDPNFMANIATEATQNGKALAADTGIISLVSSPWNPVHTVLALTGESDLAVEKAASAFSNPQFRSLSYDRFALITEKPRKLQSTEQRNKQEPISLKRLGYADQTVLGLGQNTLSYTFILPNDQMPEMLTLHTVFSHSVFTYQDHSLLTIAINGIKQSSLRLLPSNENRESWTIKIPGNVLNPGKNSLTYTFDLHIPQENCGTRFYFQAWGLIHAESTIQTTFLRTLPRIILSHFPLSFGAKTLIIVPNTLSTEEINPIVQFFLKLGALLGFDSPVFHVVGANEANLSILKSYNNILIGTPQSNPWLAKAMAPLKIEHDKVSLYDKDNKLSFINEAPLGVVQLIDSPWNNDGNALLITGTSNDAVSWAMRLLTDDKLRTQLTGNVATVNMKGILANFETRSESLNLKGGFSNKNMHVLGAYLYQNIALVIIFIFLIIVILLAAFGFYIRRKKNE